MTDRRRRNRKVALIAVAVIAIASLPAIFAPTLYSVFCAATGYGGTVRRADTAAAPVVSDQKVTVFFDANTDPDLPWDFHPEQRKVEVTLGEPVTIYYVATNRSEETIVGRAVFNVTPYEAAPFFFKIACFCFTDERLGPGESARMPVELFVDAAMLDDNDAHDVRQITLSYTFYRQDQLSQDEIDAARDLATGSDDLDARLATDDPVAYDNDAPRK